jgi:hypothetical protein
VPTEPIAALLDRDLSRVAASGLTAVTRPLLRELVNNGTNVYARCTASATGGENEDLAAPTLYLHMLQMTDAIDVLVYEGCAGGAIPNLRSSFEGLLGLTYVLEADYARRSLAWVAGFLLNKLADRARIDVTDPQSKPAQEMIGETLKRVAPIVKGDIRRWEGILDEPRMKPIADEVRRVKKWYAAFGGPASLKQLAKRLGMEAHYELLYRQWSSVAHAGELFRFLTRTKEGYAINSLRDLTELKTVAHMAALYLVRATRLMIEKYRTGEDLKPWYLREVRPLMAKLNPGLPEIVDLG